MVTIQKCILIGAAVMLAGCAGSGAARSSPGEGQNRIVLASGDSRAAQGGNLHDFIRRERPQWLTMRSTGSIGGGSQNADIVIYRDGVRAGGLEVLRETLISTVASAQYLTGAEAASRFGLDHQFGAILVVTRQP